MNSKAGMTFLFALAATSGGCQCQKLFPDKVAMGVARLSARNIGTAISLVAKDTRCGFASEAAISNATFSGPAGGEGTMTVHIDRCVLELGSTLELIATDCSGVETRAAGTVTVSGTQTIVGRRTGSPKTPMIPAAADAVSFDLTMSFSSYEVRASDSKAGLMIDSGSARVLAKPHLAVSASLGVCSISTTDLTIDAIQYDGAHVQVDPDTGFFPVDVPSSNFGVQVGRWNGRENDSHRHADGLGPRGQHSQRPRWAPTRLHARRLRDGYRLHQGFSPGRSATSAKTSTRCSPRTWRA